MNKKYKIILMLLIVIIAISSYCLIKEIAESKKENDIYNELQEIVQINTIYSNENDHIDILEEETSNLPYKENKTNNYNLDNISKINSDVIGWIKIDGTNINYPVMQNGDFYLHRNVYKNYSSSGTPYLAEHCNLKTSDNLIIYGHHMKNSTIFSNLDNYDDIVNAIKFLRKLLIKQGYTNKDIEEAVSTLELAVDMLNKHQKYFVKGYEANSSMLK